MILCDTISLSDNMLSHRIFIMKEVSVHAAVAKELRKFLKANNLVGKVTSKTYAGGNSVYVTLMDATPKQHELVEAEARRYEMGSFNGMTDSYEYDNRNKDIPQVKYTFVNIDYSDEIKQKALDVLHAEFDGDFENVPKSYAEIDHNTCVATGAYVFRCIRSVLGDERGAYQDLWKKVWEVN